MRRHSPAGAGRLAAALLACAGAARAQGTTVPSPDTVGQFWDYETPDVRLRVEVVARGLRIPWAIAFLPDGRALVSERPVGRLDLVDLGTGVTTRVEGVPPVYGEVDGGLLDVALHPDYRRNGWIYFSYAVHTDSGNTTAVDRARLDGTRLVGRRRLFTALPFVDNGSHFGSRLALRDGYLFITLGDRDQPEHAQRLDTHHGKVVRIHDDGRVPDDNPFRRRAAALPEIWSYGHRNPQGLVFEPGSGRLWEHEHGPKGGDELNLIRRGRNYGWPVISYGREYAGGPVGEGLTRREGMEQPVHYYVPSIAPSGMAWYDGRAFPAWRGSLFIGAMALRHLNRLVMDDGRVLRQERLLEDRGWRVRAVAQSPDGLLYLGVDAGLLLRIRPADPPPAAAGRR